MKYNYRLKRTSKRRFVVLQEGQYEVINRVANIMKVRVLEADGVVIKVPHAMTFHLSKKGYFYINGGCHLLNRKNEAGEGVTYAIPV